jgi:hypothetical protein
LPVLKILVGPEHHFWGPVKHWRLVPVASTIELKRGEYVFLPFG